MPDVYQLLTVIGVSGATGAILKGLFDRSGLKLTGKQQADRQQLEQDGLRRRQRIELDGQLARQRNDHDHQRVMLGQAAHFEVRKEMAALAGDVYRWIDFELMEKHGHEVELFTTNVPDRPYKEPRFAIGDLEKIAAQHPTMTVRKMASEISVDMSLAYNAFSSPTDKSEPTSDKMVEWASAVRELINAINEPPESTKPSDR